MGCLIIGERRARKRNGCGIAWVVVARTQLLSEQWDVLDDGHAHAPLVVFGEVDDCGQERHREALHANHAMDRVELRDDVQSHLRAVGGSTMRTHVGRSRARTR